MFLYLDHNATSMLRPNCAEVMTQALNPGHPHAPHRWGRQIRQQMEAARAKIADLMGAQKEQVIFTSGGTESNNLALQGWRPLSKRVFVGSTDHDSVKKVLDGAVLLPVDEQGQLLWACCAALFEASPCPFLVSVMLANNETGVVQDISQLARMVHHYGGYIHTDAVQAVGKIPVHFQELGVDCLSLSAHKYGGPPGVGALIVKDKAFLTPLLRGGGQEWGVRSGTPNVALISGFAAALNEAVADIASRARLLTQAHRKMEKTLQSLGPEIVIFGQYAQRLPNTTCISMPGVWHHTQIIAFDLAGVAVSAGAACSSGKMASSAVLEAMGFSAATTQGAIRISSGWNTRSDDLEQFTNLWQAFYKKKGADDGSAKAKNAHLSGLSGYHAL